jgi:phosphatidate cytidylyltransferase
MASSHIKRWITALVAVPALFSLIYFGSFPVFCALILAAILLGVHEYNEMAFGEGHLWEKTEGLVIALLIALSFYLGDLQLVMAVIVFSVLIVFFTYTARISQPAFDILPVVKVVFGFLYIPVMMSHFILIRNIPQQGVL